MQVALSLLAECKEIEGHEYHIFLSPNVGKGIDQSSFAANSHFYQMSQRPAQWKELFDAEDVAFWEKLKAENEFTLYD